MPKMSPYGTEFNASEGCGKFTSAVEWPPVGVGTNLRLFTESCGMYLFVYEVSLRDRSYNRLRHRTFHGEAVLGGEMTFAKIPQLSVMNHYLCPLCGKMNPLGFRRGGVKGLVPETGDL